MTWLVTGGAGYIGAHIVKAFREAGTDVVVLDSLSSGHREFVPPDVAFVHANVMDRELVRKALTKQRIEGVVHLECLDEVRRFFKNRLVHAIKSNLFCAGSYPRLVQHVFQSDAFPPSTSHRAVAQLTAGDGKKAFHDTPLVRRRSAASAGL